MDPGELMVFIRSRPRLVGMVRRVRRRLPLDRVGPSRAPTADGVSRRRGSRVAPYGQFLPAGPDRRVAVIMGRNSRSFLKELVVELGTDRLTVISLDRPPERRLPMHAALVVAHSVDDVSAALMACGPLDVIVDLDDRDAKARQATFSRALFHLRPGGVLVVDRRTGPPLTGVPGVLRLVCKLGGRLGADPEAEELTRAERELLRAAGRVVLDRRFLLVEKQGRHYAKLRFSDVDRILPARSPGVTVRRLAALEGGTLQSPIREVQHEASRPFEFDSTMPYPEAALRAYAGGVTLSSHGLLTTDSSILPESFRHYDRRTLVTARILRAHDANRDFARIKLPRPRHMRGAFYHVDPAIPGHFGHLMGEVISRLWGWDLAKAEYPDLKAVFHTSNRNPSGSLERQILTAYGIAPKDIVGVGRSVKLDTLVCAAPLWHNHEPHHVHPEMVNVWERLRAGFIGEDVAPGPRRALFISRRAGNRACRNTPEVEDVFRAHGFEVIYPEEFPLARQAELFSGARVIAGFGGSALFNVLFARQLRLLIVLNHEGYTAGNEHLSAALLGCELHYFWSKPDVEHPAGGWTDEAFKSPWAFDFERNGQDLRQLLEGLPDLVAPGS